MAWTDRMIMLKSLYDAGKEVKITLSSAYIYMYVHTQGLHNIGNRGIADLIVVH